MSGGMSTREASIFACLVDTLLAPESPLPPVAETSAVESFGVWMSRFPAGGRIGVDDLRAGLNLVFNVGSSHVFLLTIHS